MPLLELATILGPHVGYTGLLPDMLDKLQGRRGEETLADYQCYLFSVLLAGLAANAAFVSCKSSDPIAPCNKLPDDILADIPRWPDHQHTEVLLEISQVK